MNSKLPDITMYDDDVCMIKNYDKIMIKKNQWERLWHHIVTFRVFTHVATLGFHDTEINYLKLQRQ